VENRKGKDSGKWRKEKRGGGWSCIFKYLGRTTEEIEVTGARTRLEVDSRAKGIQSMALRPAGTGSPTRNVWMRDFQKVHREGGEGSERKGEKEASRVAKKVGGGWLKRNVEGCLFPAFWGKLLVWSLSERDRPSVPGVSLGIMREENRESVPNFPLPSRSSMARYV